mmetsp:Transcript_15013/g.27224  ORF Transcript_15013/g.27224 Transcript_15013/m.27224 type:complete len:476 (-) Transcript_15013:142-1569(-)
MTIVSITREPMPCWPCVSQNCNNVSMRINIMATARVRPLSFFEPYLQTLPSSYDELPRHWPSELLDQLLTGSPLLRRVNDSRSSIRAHYQIFKDEWGEKNGTNEEQELEKSLFPTFEEFDTMVGAVSSRAFGGLVRRKHVVITTNDDDDDDDDDDANVIQKNEEEGNLEDLEEDAMVPLLDLLDHCRGKQGDTKNVSYDRNDDDADGSMIVIRVTSDASLVPNTPLRNTYGAKGNSQLLIHYGFCLLDNLEPDGSSNDVLEFSPQEGTAMVELRAGPKSYTFGGLIKALQYFYPTNHDHDENSNRDDEKQQEDGGGSNDLESFLNDCEEEDDPWGYQDNDDDEEEEEEESEDMELVGNELEADCDALQKLKVALQKAKNAYSLKGDTLMEALERNDSSRHYHAAILVSSEQRTLSLYMRAIDLILKVLLQTQFKWGGADTPLVESLLEHQAFELSTAFLQIRYPSHLPVCPSKKD